MMIVCILSTSAIDRSAESARLSDSSSYVVSILHCPVIGARLHRTFDESLTDHIGASYGLSISQRIDVSSYETSSPRSPFIRLGPTTTTTTTAKKRVLTGLAPL